MYPHSFIPTNTKPLHQALENCVVVFFDMANFVELTRDFADKDVVFVITTTQLKDICVVGRIMARLWLATLALADDNLIIGEKPLIWQRVWNTTQNSIVSI